MSAVAAVLAAACLAQGGGCGRRGLTLASGPA